MEITAILVARTRFLGTFNGSEGGTRLPQGLERVGWGTKH
jgi:hypothetical protein